MSNSKHTPGPWLRMGRSIGNGAGEIATVWGLRDERAIANARLIAAAPEMLAALKAIVDCAGPGAGPEIGLALDAIQKATGDTP